MLREAVMTRKNVNVTNLNSASTAQSILLRHDFSFLSTRDDGTQIVTRNYECQGVACCDILVYRSVLKEKGPLRNAVRSLIQALSDLQSQLQEDSHQLIPQFQRHSINFFRKKASVLTNESRHPISCQIIPLLLYQTEDALPSIRDRATAYPVQLIHLDHLEEFLIQNFPKRELAPKTSYKRFQFLRRSYRNLGITILLLPIVLGLSGILLGLQLILFAFLTTLFGVLGMIILLRRATSSFTQFQVLNAIPVYTTKSSPQTPAQNGVPPVLLSQFEDILMNSTVTSLSRSIEGEAGDD